MTIVFFYYDVERSMNIMKSNDFEFNVEIDFAIDHIEYRTIANATSSAVEDEKID